MTRLPPAQKVHVRLLKSHIREMEDAFEDDLDLKEINLKRDLGFTGKLFIDKPTQSPPRWFEFVQTGVANDIGTLTNRNNAAVLMIKKSEKIFAFSFGQGRHLIKPSAFVSDFGIKTALNGLNHESLRSIDTFTIEEQTIHKTTQASKHSGVGAFGLDVGRDILKSATGTPRSDVPEIIKGLSGNESVVAVSAKVDFAGLGTLCDELHTLYKKKTYKENFGWVDNIRRVRDEELLKDLNTRLIDDLRKGGACFSRISPPETVDWDEIQFFSYSHNRDHQGEDMSIAEYLEGLGDPQNIDLVQLEHDKVFAHSDDDQLVNSWPIFKCLVFETKLRNNRYFLTDGEWFEIDGDFASGVRRSIGTIETSIDYLPKIQRIGGKLQAEKDYNERVGQEITTMAVLDRKLVKCLSAHTPVEACDLLSDRREMIHAKHRKGGSSSLSHLFAQARISSDAFMADQTYRKEIRRELRALRQGWERRVPVEQPKPADFPVVFAILGIDGADFLEQLPFFSQLNLVRTADAMRARGFPVRVVGVQVE